MSKNHLQQRPADSACETLNGANRYRANNRKPRLAIPGLSIAAAFAITASFTGCGGDDTTPVPTTSGSPAVTGAAGMTVPTSTGATGVGGSKTTGVGAGGKATASAGKSGGTAGKKTTTTKGAGGKVVETETGGKPATGGGAGSSSPGNAKVPQVENTVDPGPFEVKYDTNTGPSGSSYIFYPTELGKNGMLHPVMTWGPGAMTGPANYIDHLTQIASHGFVVISQASSGTGALEKSALDYMFEQNETSGSPFYKKLDPTKVAAGGHSLGALTTYAMAADERLTTYVLVCGGGGTATIPQMHAPAIILGGTTDMATPAFETDYTAMTVPVVFLIKDGVDHIACAREHLAPWVAWMRWHLYGETKWKPDFWEGGVYCKAPWSNCRQKNWE